jgi:hypothetical protein
MNFLRTALIVLACAAAPACFAQWQWLDASGRKVFSDQPPPPDIPASRILKQPGKHAAAMEAAAPMAAPAPAAPKVSGTDKELEAKQKAASAAAAAKKKEQDEETAKVRADNCQRAKTAKATLDSGVRLSTTNSKGEREIMDDNARTAEGKRLQSIIDGNCNG